MGEVYRARDSILGRDVALKVLAPALAGDSQYMARFQREAQVLASLNHPHIAILHGLQECDGVRALVMELVEGPTLAERISAGPIPVAEALPIARQIADALEAAHERGVVHRDLKPANVKFTGEGAVKVLDFGLAKALDDDAAPTGVNSPTLTLTATRAGVILGTAGYMAPEQAKGKRADRRVDIWAFGVVLFEMLTGRRIHEGETVLETLASVMRDEAPWDALPADLPPAIGALLRRCLDKDPKLRLRDIGEARIALAGAASGAGAVAAVSGDARAPGSWPWLPWALAAIATVAALASAFFHWRDQPVERALQFGVAPPPKGSVFNFALSPDGRYLAMSILAEGKYQLWVRALDSLQPRLVPGTDDAAFPFWSPDSRYIGFFAEGKLKKVALAGGPAQTLCEAEGGRGGTWNREGVIVFASAIRGPLRRVQAAGGSPVSLAKDTHGALHRFPVFLPDGKRFLYVISGAGDGSGLYMGSLDSESAERLLPDNSSAAYVPPHSGSKNGYLFFIREGTLMAQPVEPGTLRPAGEAFPFAEQVDYSGVVGYAPVSVSVDGLLAYQIGAGSAATHQLSWYDRGGRELVKAGTAAPMAGFALSADEKNCAVVRLGAGGRTGTDIWLRDMARGVETRFTTNPSRNLLPVWSPDGRRMVFGSVRSGIFSLYIKDTSGSAQEELLQKPQFSQFPTDWSRDGRLLLYVNTDSKTKWDLWTVPVDGERKPAPFLQTEFNECQGQFSPDGKWVAYASDESGPYEIYVRPFPAAAGKWRISIRGGQFPRWRRDGKELFYLSPDRKLMAVTIQAVPGAQPALEAAIPQALFDCSTASIAAGFNVFNYAVAADGKRFLMNTAGRDTVEAPVILVTNWLAGIKK